MKGIVFEEVFYEGATGKIHGGEQCIRRIYFPDLGVAVTTHQKQIYVGKRNPAEDTAIDDNHLPPHIVGEVDVPDEQVRAYAELHAARERAEKYIKPLEELLALVGSNPAAA